MPPRARIPFRGVPPVRKRTIVPAQGTNADVFMVLAEIYPIYEKFMAAMPIVETALQTFRAIKKGGKGDKGDKGDSVKGNPGADGKNVTEQEVLAVIQRVLRQPKDGIAPTADDVATTLLSSKKFLRFVQSALKQDKGEAIELSAIQAMIEDALSAFKVKVKVGDIEGLEGRIAEIRNHAATGGANGKWRGGGDTVVAGPGIQIVPTVNGNKEIIATNTGQTLHFEIPTGVVDDSNTSFAVTHEPLYITVNGSQYIVGTGAYASYGAGVVTLAYPVGAGGFIISAYNA